MVHFPDGSLTWLVNSLLGLSWAFGLHVGISTELLGFNKARWIGSQAQEMEAANPLKSESRKGAHHHSLHSIGQISTEPF